VGNGTNGIRIDVDADWIPSVQMPRPNNDWVAWLMESGEDETREGTHHRQNTRSHIKQLIWWTMSPINLRGRSAWLRKTHRSSRSMRPTFIRLVRALPED
jgi:hypothetical protein